MHYRRADLEDFGEVAGFGGEEFFDSGGESFVKAFEVNQVGLEVEGDEGGVAVLGDKGADEEGVVEGGDFGGGNVFGSIGER